MPAWAVVYHTFSNLAGLSSLDKRKDQVIGEFGFSSFAVWPISTSPHVATLVEEEREGGGSHGEM